MQLNKTEIRSEIFNIEFILKSYILRHIIGVSPKYNYPEEVGVNPAFQRIEDVKTPLRLYEKRIFALRSDFVLATGVKNAEQKNGYHGLKETFAESQYSYLNWNDRYGHPSIAISDNKYDGKVIYAGFICQRDEYLEIFLSSGRYNRYNRISEGVLSLTTEQIFVAESYLALKFQKAYGVQKVIFHDTTPEQDEVDSKIFFTNQPLNLINTSKPFRTYDSSSIIKAVAIARCDSYYEEAQAYIRNNILPVNPKYSYPGEDCINPGYQDISSIEKPLNLNEKRIWVLRTDFILATGIKNAYEKEYRYTGFKEAFSESLHGYLNFKDRYGHPSLTIADYNYDGSAYYAGYICQRVDYLQVYLVSGRFERSDLNLEQISILEAYIADQFQLVFGNQDIVFDYGNSDDTRYHATFFSDSLFDKTNPQRRYNKEKIRNILQNIPTNLNEDNLQKNNRLNGL